VQACFNTNEVYNLPLQYILPRWTKYAKTGFYIEKQGTEKEDLKTQAALISRQATSLALKCSPSKQLLDKLQKALHSLNLQKPIIAYVFYYNLLLNCYYLIYLIVGEDASVLTRDERADPNQMIVRH
jgi:hypothetical protein